MRFETKVWMLMAGGLAFVSALGCGSGAPVPNQGQLLRGPCETVAGWESVTVPYEHFDEPSETGAGVEFCIPPETKLSATVNVEHGVSLRGPDVTADLVLEVRDDFEAARGHMEFYDATFCGKDQYAWEYFDVFGWPALEQRFDEDLDGNLGRATTEYVHVAAGHHFLTLGVSVVPAGPSLLVDAVSSIGRTLKSHNEDPAVDVDQVIAELIDMRPASCP